MKVVVAVQARLGSTRLPGKVLLPVAGEPMLLRQLQRLSSTRLVHEICVATTSSLEDDPIRDLCRRAGVRAVSGHPTDLLDRHYRTGLATGADVLVKLSADSPLIDPAIVDQVVGVFRRRPAELDLATNLFPPSFPDGNAVEVIPMDVLRVAWREAERPLEREHTTPFICNHPTRFRLANVRWETGLDYSKSHRFRVSHREDYEFVRAIYEALWSPVRVFHLGEILELTARHADLGRRRRQRRQGFGVRRARGERISGDWSAGGTGTD